MQIYRECEDAWRLTLNGDLNIPVARADEFCEGPCFSETHLALNCIDEIVHHFRFFNRATVYNIRETLKSGCSYGPERGFDSRDHFLIWSRLVLLFLVLNVEFKFACRHFQRSRAHRRWRRKWKWENEGKVWTVAWDCVVHHCLASLRAVLMFNL